MSNTPQKEGFFAGKTMRAEIRRKVQELLPQNRGDEKVLVIFSSSFRKRLALALQIWLLNDCTAETKPKICLEAESFVGPTDWKAFIQGSNPAYLFGRINTIPNGNSATDTVHLLGAWNGFLVLALPNGGEKHLPGLTASEEAWNKAHDESAQTLAEVFGGDVVTVGMDAVISRSKVLPEGATGDRETKLLGKPVGHDPRLQEAEYAEYLALVHDYITEVVGMNIAIELENIAATVLRKLKVLGTVIEENSLFAESYVTVVTTITEELLAQIHHKLNREAAGFQLLQWVLIAQEEWGFLADSLVKKLNSGFFKDTRREDYESYRDFLTVCEVLGVSFITIANMLEKEQNDHVK